MDVCSTTTVKTTRVLAAAYKHVPGPKQDGDRLAASGLGDLDRQQLDGCFGALELAAPPVQALRDDAMLTAVVDRRQPALAPRRDHGPCFNLCPLSVCHRHLDARGSTAATITSRRRRPDGYEVPDEQHAEVQPGSYRGAARLFVRRVMRGAQRFDFRIERGFVEELVQGFVKAMAAASRGRQEQVLLLRFSSAHRHERSRSQPPPGGDPRGAIFTSAC